MAALFLLDSPHGPKNLCRQKKWQRWMKGRSLRSNSRPAGSIGSLMKTAMSFFTDHPGKDATSEEVKLKKTNTVPVERVEMPEQLLESEEEEDGTGAPSGGYSRLVIDSPEPGETLRNPSEPVPVQVTLTPSLKGDDKLVLFDNGAPQPAMQLEAPERGAHSLVVKVVGADGQVKMVSAAVEVFVHRSTASDFRPRPPIIDRNGPAADVARPPSRGGAAQVGGAAVSGGGASPGGAASPGKPAQPSRPRPAR